MCNMNTFMPGLAIADSLESLESLESMSEVHAVPHEHFYARFGHGSCPVCSSSLASSLWTQCRLTQDHIWESILETGEQYMAWFGVFLCFEKETGEKYGLVW